MDKATNPHGSMANTANPSWFDKLGTVSLRFSQSAPDAACWVLFIQLEGTSACRINGAPITLEKADACLLRPADTFRLQAAEADSSRYFSILVDCDFISRQANLVDLTLYSNLLGSTHPLLFHLTPTLLSELAAAAPALQSGQPLKQEDIRSCRLLLQKLFIRFLEQYPYDRLKYPLWLLQFIEQLQDLDTFCTPLSQLARLTPYSYSRLTHLFKEYMGVSLVDYVTDIKLKYAKQLLTTTDFTMLAISSKLEFSVSYFNKLFKRKTGLTPGAYRKEHRNR